MYQLKLNDQLITEGDLKSLTALFNDLSGISFARSKTKPSWLDKMSATESYASYLNIKAAEYGLLKWTGTLFLLDKNGNVARAHIFGTHKKVTEDAHNKNDSHKKAI